MAHFKILGSLAGTEPMAGRHHTSLVLSAGDRNYFFDAGENCVHTAYTEGVDLMQIRAVFISHTHFDHIGGLMGLFWTVHKLYTRYKREVADGKIRLFIPQTETWEHIYGALKNTEGGFRHSFDIEVDVPRLGTFYEDENLRVTAFESHHLPHTDDGRIRSFSYRVETEGKSAVFSGDVKDMDDLVEAVGEGCDLLLCETGHHEVRAVCEFAQSHKVGRLALVHHGREILEERESVKEALAACKIPVVITSDRETVEL